MSAEHPVSPSLHDRLNVAPPEDWVALREEADCAAPAVNGTNPVLLLDRQHHVARRESYERVVRRLDTMQAVHEAAQWRLTFDPGMQWLTLHALTVRRAGASRDHAQPGAIRLLQREEGLDRLVVDGWVTAVVLLEDVRVGDIVDASYTLRTVPRILPDHCWLFASVPSHLPLQRFRLAVRFPQSAVLRWKSSAGTFAPAVSEAGDETVWTWSAEGLPAEEREPGVPGWHLVERWVQVSDLASWGEVAAGVTAAWGEHFADPELLVVAEEITAAAATPADRCARALTFIQDEVRYLSLETGFGGQIPAPPGTVLRRRFGDCKDKSFLAAHLLRRLGIPARPVLVSTVLRGTVEELLPMPAAFNHAVVEYEIEGQRRWVDVTRPQQGGGAFLRPVPDFGRGLPVAPGVTELERQPEPPATRDLYELHETFFVDTAGRTSTLRILLTTRGCEAETLRQSFAHEGAETIARQREQFYLRLFPDLKRVGRLEWRDDREANEFLLGEAYDAQRLLVPGPDASVGIFEFPAYLIRSLLTFPDTAKRRQPLALPHPCNVEHRIEIESPAIERGAKQSGRSQGAPFAFAYSIAQQPGRFSASFSLRTRVDTVPAEKFTGFKEKVAEVWGWTLIRFPLPLGVAVPWGHRQTGRLLPKARVGAAPAAAVADSFGAGSVPSEIAPSLGSVPDPEPEEEPVLAADSEADSSAEMNAAPGHRRHHRRRHRKHQKVPILAITLGILLILATAVMVGFILSQKKAASRAVGSDQANTRKIPLSDIPHALPGEQQRRPEERSFFPKKPGQDPAPTGNPSGQPAALPPELGLLPQN